MLSYLRSGMRKTYELGRLPAFERGLMHGKGCYQGIRRYTMGLKLMGFRVFGRLGFSLGLRVRGSAVYLRLALCAQHLASKCRRWQC